MDAIYQVRGDIAFGFSRDTRTWATIDVSLPVKTLCNNYHSFEVGLESLGKKYGFKSDYFLNELPQFSGTLQEWLNTKAGVNLPALTNGFPVLEFAQGHYQSLHANIGPEAYLCPPNYHYTQDFAVDDAHDVVVLATSDDQTVLSTNALWNVNGQWVPHKKDAVGVRLPGAGDVVRLSGQFDLGCWFFNDIGSVTTYPMKDLNIDKLDTSLDYYSTLLVNVPESITGKTVGYVIGGILHWLPSKGYYSDKSIMLSLPNFSVVKTIMETRNYYDWEAIGLGELSTPTSVAALRNPENFKAMLQHPSSFLVVIDNPWLEFEEVGLDHGASYGRFHQRDPNDIDSEKPLGPLFNDFGKCIGYWPTWEEGEWTFHTNEITRENLTMTHARWNKQRKVNDAIAIHSAVPYRTINAIMHRVKARKK